MTAYYTGRPDPANPAERVAFGTSGHRGSSLDNAFNEGHILAITQAICEHRRQKTVDGPLFLGIDTHALSEPAFASALEVLAAHGVEVRIDAEGGYTPTPVVSHAILTLQPRPERRARRRDRRDAVPQPAAVRRLQVQPAARRPRRHGRDGVDREAGQRAPRRRPRRRRTHAVSAGARRADHARPRLPRGVRLRSRLRRRPRRRAFGGRAHRRRSARRGECGVLGRDPRAVRARPRRRQPHGRPDVPVHDRRLGRADPDGPVLAVRDGAAAGAQGPLRRRLRRRHRRGPARHRDAQPTACFRPTTTSRRRSRTSSPIVRSGRPARPSARRWSRAA